VAECLEVVLVGYFDVPHPVEQISRLRITDCVSDELARHRHVSVALGDVELVRNRRLKLTSRLVIAPSILEPIREEMSADKREDFTMNK